MRLRPLAIFVSAAAAASVLTAAQQVVDSSFKPVVAAPAYPGGGPTVAIDEAHSNFHTAAGQYKPFADLLSADGYRVTALNQTFAPAAFKGIDVLVIANARNLEAMKAGDLTQSAFSDAECDAVREWVGGGGSLLVIADHAPFGGAAAALASRFGVGMGKGWAFDQAAGGGLTTQLEYSRTNGALGEHPILRGRNQTEVVNVVKAFTGQSLLAPEGATHLLKFSGSAREAATTDDLNAEDSAVRGPDKSAMGSRSQSVAGRVQGLAMTFGKGRVVFLGEAGMFSAQIIRAADGTERKFGMNTLGHDDQQFALNVLHWLTGMLK